MTSNFPPQSKLCYMHTLAYYKSFTDVFQSYKRHTHSLCLRPAVFCVHQRQQSRKTAMLAGTVRGKWSPSCTAICARKYFKELKTGWDDWIISHRMDCLIWAALTESAQEMSRSLREAERSMSVWLMWERCGILFTWHCATPEEFITKLFSTRLHVKYS